ncbi:type II toxin-antitoxin system RatA family toxin [Granulosicoccaceae sp. 1_MG-2023]|nr:type II toxin-antitoxin system RatA family toxin [Granulosicoccaceae sp. 1_MG-2023]
MTRICKSALVMHTPHEMYRLVNEVEHYPGFLPWCRRAEVLERDETTQRATLEMARGPLNKSFTTRNSMIPDAEIHLHLEDGPFDKLEGIWRFVPLGEKGCKVTLDMEFSFSSRMLGAVLNPVFSEICSTLVDAFVKRANQVYKRG